MCGAIVNPIPVHPAANIDELAPETFFRERGAGSSASWPSCYTAGSAVVGWSVLAQMCDRIFSHGFVRWRSGDRLDRFLVIR